MSTLQNGRNLLVGALFLLKYFIVDAFHFSGEKGDVAAASIKHDSKLAVQVVRMGAPVTADFRTDRVRVYVDSAGFVVRPPRIG